VLGFLFSSYRVSLYGGISYFISVLLISYYRDYLVQVSLIWFLLLYFYLQEILLLVVLVLGVAFLFRDWIWGLRAGDTEREK